MTILCKFAKEVRRTRKQLGLTQEQVAETLSISSRWLQYIESGKRRPGTVLTLNLIALLGIDGSNLQDKK